MENLSEKRKFIIFNQTRTTFTTKSMIMRFCSLLSCLSILIFVACKTDSTDSSSPDVQAPADALFKQIQAQASGVNFVNPIEETYQNNIITNPYLYNGGGVAIIDFDRDGLEDLFFTSTMQSCKLYRNLGGLKFQDMTDASGINTKEGIKTGVSIVDINGDGWDDIYICRTGLTADFNRANQLWVNQQNGTFKEMAADMGLNSNAPTNQAAFFDYDLDGDLDVYMLNHPADFAKIAQVRVNRAPDGSLHRDTQSPLDVNADRLYRNDQGRFVDVTAAAGMKDFAWGLSVAVSDINRDGWPDLMVFNDYIEPDIVYINQKGTFVDKTDQWFKHMSSQSMGSDLADFNRDGQMDLFVMDMLPADYTRTVALEQGMGYERQHTLISYGYKNQNTRNVLQMSASHDRMSEIACYANLGQTDWSWSPLAADFDLDGATDLFISNGMRRDVTNLDYTKFTTDSVENAGGLTQQRFPDINEYLKLIPSSKQRNFTFRNTGDMRFEDVSVAWGIVAKTYTNGVAYADLDKDGDLDLVLNNINDYAHIYQNTAADRKMGHYLNVQLQSDQPSNRQAIGAKVQAKIGDQIFYQEIMPVRGFFSTSTLMTQITLGKATQVDILEVEFPGKKLVQMRNIAADQLLTISSSNAKPGTLSQLAEQIVPVLRSAKAPSYTHQQPDEQDFLKQRLLPWSISDAGPCMSAEAINADGLQGVYIGGGVNQAGMVWVQGASGQWTAKPSAALEADKAMIDAAATFFDADADGDLDLAVGNGGAAWPANHAQYQARLYLNDGSGGFAKAPSTLPCTVPVGSILPIDLDGDKDIDLLMAESHRLDNYPLKLGVKCLINDGKGNFSDGTNTIGAAMQQLGRVTDMHLLNTNQDPQPEIVMVGEWMPITVLQNTGGKWTNISTSLGLADTEGLWNTLEVADLNNDGASDLVVGNLGWNTRYRASAQEPILMYGSDFDRNGAQDPIMCFTKDGKEFPFAYRDVMVAQVPAIKKKMIRYGTYASATVTDMFSPDAVGKAEKNTCKILESSIFYLKNNRFERVALPNLAQTSTVHAITITDLNKDTWADIICAGNDFGHQSEVGRIDAGTGMVLINQKGENFKYLSSAQSGFWAEQQVRSIKTIKNGAKAQVWVGSHNAPLQVFEY
jgi:enediyne biosynthesis protein E4